jgi:hypothetical protein
MAWTVVDDDDVIQVRASINAVSQVDELENLIAALIRRLPKQEKPSDDQGLPVIRPQPGNSGGAAALTQKAEA